MIDLHIHTKASDGTDSTAKLLEKAGNLGLEMISITDHNTVKAYFDIEKLRENRFVLYEGLIMVGCEFTTSFEGHLIEVLGYHFDYKEMDVYLKKAYLGKKKRERDSLIEERILEKIDRFGLQYDRKNLKHSLFKNRFFPFQIYTEIMQYPENKERVREDIFHGFSDFYRKGLTNPESAFFIHIGELYPPLEEVIRMIHEMGGIALLAHPYQYKHPPISLFLDKLFALHKLDGIECFYTNHTEEETRFLVEYAKKYRLLMSGGSDYHGENKKNYKLGVDFGNLNVPKEIVAKWTEGPRPSERRKSL